MRGTRVVAAIVGIARNLKAHGNSSFRALLDLSGFTGGEITQKELRDAITANSTVVEDWLAYSEDKRVDSGWYFRERAGGYEVGHMGRDGTTTESRRFEQCEDACAYFIQLEIRSARLRATS